VRDQRPDARGEKVAADYAAFVNDLHQNNVEAGWHAPDPVIDAPHRPGVP